MKAGVRGEGGRTETERTADGRHADDQATADAGAGSGYGDRPRTDGTGEARADQEDAEGPRRCVPLGHDDRGAARRDGRKGRGDLLHSPEGIGSHGLRAEAVRAQ